MNTVTYAIARKEREIALMQEYRTRLTADLMTGKLDVRKAFAKLPEETLCNAIDVGDAEILTTEDVPESDPE